MIAATKSKIAPGKLLIGGQWSDASDGKTFDTVDPLSAFDMRDRIQRQASSKSIKTAVIFVFIFSLIGMLAPLMLLISCIWVLMNKAKIATAGPVYTVLGYASIGLSAVYTALMLIVAISNG